MTIKRCPGANAAAGVLAGIDQLSIVAGIGDAASGFSVQGSDLLHSTFVVPWLFVIRHSPFHDPVVMCSRGSVVPAYLLVSSLFVLRLVSCLAVAVLFIAAHG